MVLLPNSIVFRDFEFFGVVGLVQPQFNTNFLRWLPWTSPIPAGKYRELIPLLS